MPHTETPFSQAIFKMFDNLDSSLLKNNADLSNEGEAIRVYLFGGCAVHLHIGSRVTNDVDAELKKISKLPIDELLIKPVTFKNDQGLRKSLYLDRNFDKSLASIDPEYEDRAIFLYTTKFKLVSIYLVSAVDIAVSKLSRFEINDRQDIKNLYLQGLFTSKEFQDVASEAHSYCAVAPDKLLLNIRQALEMIEEVSK
ncbi:MAG: DUF6036 family nucleotidyltransferase [Cyanobacteria bacterium J06621_12]